MRLAKFVKFREEKFGGVLFETKSEKVFTLTTSAAAIVREINLGGGDEAAIAARLKTQFDARDSHFDRDSLRDDPRWFAVDIKFEAKFAREVTLPELRDTKALGEMVLLRRGSRLSVQPVTPGEWKQILKMGAKA